MIDCFRRLFVSLAIALALVVAVGARAAPPAKADPPAPTRLKVVATIGMIADVVRGVAGDRAEVVALIPPGVDPHLYRPTRSDVQRLMQADLVFYNGHLLEGKMTDTLIRAAKAGRKVYAVAELVDEANARSSETGNDKDDALVDPHLWMDPSLWMKTIDVVRDRLVERDPAGTAAYRGNADAYRRTIAELDAYAARVLASVPQSRRVLVTAHDAFGYFGRRYGFEVVGIQGISTESEAGVQDIERIVELLVRRGISAIFVESTVSDRNVRALVTGAKAKGHEVAIGGELFSDAMGADGTYEGTYVGMIDHNATTIARALGGEAPQRGMRGLLAAPR
jgi:manganese/zinc/iron transport system substrate-binding protein